jgi:serine/threonine-protein kinase
MERPAGLQSADTFAVPRIFGRLLLLKLVARGGMGDVYLAATTGIEGAERPVIVKTVRRDHLHDGSFLARFLDEARVQSQLNHPGVAQVLEATTDEGGEPYTVVEHVEGRSLADVRHRAIQMGVRFGWPEALAIGVEMAQALAHVHERQGSEGAPLGIVHRDLSPQNVMVGYAGEVKLIDFGTARGQNRRCHTVAGVVFAKPGYVAPEIARHEVGDGRIDVYALGVMLWELCAGRRYLTGDAQKHLEDAAAGTLVMPPLAAEIGAPPELDAVIARLTKNDPKERLTAAQGATELAGVLAQAPAVAAGERGVRQRVALLMRALFPLEPAKSRAEFARLLRDARSLRKATVTPSAPDVAQKAADNMDAEGGLLAGTSYRLKRKIGEGASGTVWEAEHVELGRKLAIKVLQPEHGASPDAIERFRREARVLAGLSHPNLVALHDFGRALDGRVFLAMELLEGETLDVRGARPWREAVHLGVQATRALEAAHAAGLVHRDLKPHNLFLTHGGLLKLLDFGVAMALSDPTEGKGAEPVERPRGFAIFGTPEYMAPEQIAGENVDARCDVYALGCVLYELLTGERPFNGPSSVVVLGKQLREEAEPIRVRAPEQGVPEILEQVVMRALRKRPEDRFSTAAEMRSALEAAIREADASIPIAMPSTKALQKQKADVRRAKLARGMAIGTTSLALALAFGFAFARPAARPADVNELTAAVPTTDLAPPPPVELPAQAPAQTPMAVQEPDAPAATVEATPDVAPQAPQAPQTPPHVVAKEPAARLADARSAARAHPGDVRKLRAWAQAARAAGDLREARRAADAWALRDGSPDPKLFLAQLQEKQGHKAEAKQILAELLEKYPDHEDARKMQARLGGAVPSGGKKTELARR